MGTWRNGISAALCEGAGWRFESSRSLHFSGFVAQLDSERKNSNLEAAGSNPAEVISIMDFGFFNCQIPVYFGFV